MRSWQSIPRLSRTVLVAAPLLGVVACAALAASPSVPVMAGTVADLAACMTLGEVRGLNPDGDGFLAVRSGPGADHAMLDKLHEGQRVFMCDERGAWIGIVYSNDPDVDCGVTSPWPRRAAYRGPCRSGWAHRRWIKAIAG